MTADMSWLDFPGPRHEDEIMLAHQGAPTPAASVRMGVTAPAAEDRGMSDQEKYGGGTTPAAM